MLKMKTHWFLKNAIKEQEINVPIYFQLKCKFFLQSFNNMCTEQNSLVSALIL